LILWLSPFLYYIIRTAVISTDRRTSVKGTSEMRQPGHEADYSPTSIAKEYGNFTLQFSRPFHILWEILSLFFILKQRQYLKFLIEL